MRGCAVLWPRTRGFSSTKMWAWPAALCTLPEHDADDDELPFHIVAFGFPDAILSMPMSNKKKKKKTPKLQD